MKTLLKDWLSHKKRYNVYIHHNLRMKLWNIRINMDKLASTLKTTSLLLNLVGMLPLDFYEYSKLSCVLIG